MSRIGAILIFFNLIFLSIWNEGEGGGGKGGVDAVVMIVNSALFGRARKFQSEFIGWC